MGAEKSGSSTTINQSSTPTPTAEETKLNQLQLQDYEASQAGRQQVNASGLNLANLLLQGQNLPGYLQNLPGGISPDVTQSIVDQSLRDIKPSFQQGGILDSGVAASISARTAGDIRNQSAQFNMQNLQQLLNLAVGGQAVPLSYGTDIAGQLGGRLAGLRTTNTTGTQNTTTTGMNPFMKSFQTSLGGALGNPFQSYQQAGAGFAGFTGGLRG